MYIFLDDERLPRDVTWMTLPKLAPWVVVRNYNQFVNMINSTRDISFISFDHDLADQHYGHGLNDDEINYDHFTEKTGMDCAKALVDWCITYNKPVPTYAVHSMNPVGRKNIESLLENYKNFSLA